MDHPAAGEYREERAHGPGHGILFEGAGSATVATAAASSLLPSACDGTGTPLTVGVDGTTDQRAPASITDAQASRFLAQASMGASREQIARVKTLGYVGWLEEQFAMAPSTTRWDWLVQQGFADVSYRNGQGGFDAAVWRKLFASPDTLRQRVTLALSEIVVTSIDGYTGAWRAFTGAAYLDLLESQAFGNYRALLGLVSQSTAMGEYLTFRGNVKYNATTGAMPDENYAREILQLFTIGLYQLNADGSLVINGGLPVETYGQDDITGLARVFTGWDYNLAGRDTSTPDYQRRAMTQVAARHETGAKTFLDFTIPAGTDGARSLDMALDWIFAHPNVPPFVSRQLIQRLVCSNPSAAYIGRVSAVFRNDGNGVRGNLKSVVAAILLDDEARNEANLQTPSFGKLREPMLRFIAWGRAFGATSASNAWNIGNTTDAATRLAQSPLRSPSVFNYFRPGYTPPNSLIAGAQLVAPEFQITNESTVVGYLNYMQTAISRGIGDVRADYTALLALADNSGNLVAEINSVLAAGQLESNTVTTIRAALDTMPTGTTTARTNRVQAALLLVLAAPEFIVQK